MSIKHELIMAKMYLQKRLIETETFVMSTKAHKPMDKKVEHISKAIDIIDKAIDIEEVT